MRPLVILLLLLLVAPASAEDGPPRVLILGDSLSAGAYASQPGAAYAGRVAASLGATDTTLVRARVRLEGAEVSWDVFGPQGWDIVILEVGINDSLSPTIGDAAWTQRYSALTAAISSTGAALVCVTPFDVGLPINLGARAELIRASCVGGRVADVWGATEGQAGYRATIGAPTFFGTGRVDDGYHPTDEGHALIARLILEAAQQRAYLPQVTQ